MRWKKKNGCVLKKAEEFLIIWHIAGAARESFPNTMRLLQGDVRSRMAQTCILTGMVLKTAPAGEYDKRITLLTREQGKITAFVRGARRPKSALQAATDLFCFGKFEAYEGRDAFTVVKAEISNYFRELYEDLDKTYYGCYFLEMADYFTQPYNADGRQQLKFLYQTLRALSVPSLEHRLVRRIYELKTLTLYGVQPNVFSCVKCGKKERFRRFSLRDRGVLCENCMEKQTAYPLNAAALYTLLYLITAPVEKLYTFRVTDEVYEMISRILDDYLKLYVDREFKTLAFLPDT